MNDKYNSLTLHIKMRCVKVNIMLRNSCLFDTISIKSAKFRTTAQTF